MVERVKAVLRSSHAELVCVSIKLTVPILPLQHCPEFIRGAQFPM